MASTHRRPRFPPFNPPRTGNEDATATVRGVGDGSPRVRPDSRHFRRCLFRAHHRDEANLGDTGRWAD